MRYRIMLFLMLLSSSRVLGQNPVTPTTSPATPTPSEVPPRAETILSKTVVRITGVAEGVGAFNATGFIVFIPDPRLPGNVGAKYLVTNRHVAQAMEPDASGSSVSHKVLSMHASINLKTPVGGTRVREIPLPSNGEPGWEYPADTSIDLAVLPINLDGSFDIMELPTGLFLTEDLWDKFRVVPGDKVMTCGYFVHYAGAHQFQPIVREGSLAMVPDDAMAVPIGGTAKVYLADLHIIPGNSGSPLFLSPQFTLGGMVTDGKSLPYGLIGVVSGYMWEDDKLTLHASSDFEGTLHANSGIATIVPVGQLKALLESPKLQHQRDTTLEQYKVQHPEVMSAPKN